MTAGWLLWVKPEALVGVFGNASPRSNAVEIMDLLIEPLGPSIVIRFNIVEFPATLPVKWTLGDFNTVQVTTQLYNISDLSLSGQAGSSNQCTLSVTDGAKGTWTLIVGVNFRMSFNAEFASTRFSAYCDGRRQTPEI